jgi:hypothetical protein
VCPAECPPLDVRTAARWVTFEGVPDRKVAEVSTSTWVLLAAFVTVGVVYAVILRAVDQEVRDR